MLLEWGGPRARSEGSEEHSWPGLGMRVGPFSKEPLKGLKEGGSEADVCAGKGALRRVEWGWQGLHGGSHQPGGCAAVQHRVQGCGV